MAKKEIDYSKVKALASSILECIGDIDGEGSDPTLPPQKQDIGNGGQDELYSFSPAGEDFSTPDKENGNDANDPDEASEGHEGEPASHEKKKASISMMAGLLRKKMSK